MITKLSRNKERVRRHKRVRSKLSGTSSTPRLVVFRSNKHIEVQVIDDTKGVTLVAVNSKKIDKANNIEVAKKVGTEVAKACLAKKINKVVFDRGGYIYHGKIEALANAAREAGLKF